MLTCAQLCGQSLNRFGTNVEVYVLVAGGSCVYGYHDMLAVQALSSSAIHGLRYLFAISSSYYAIYISSLFVWRCADIPKVVCFVD